MKKTFLCNLILFISCIHAHAQFMMILAGRDTVILDHINKGDSLFKIGETKGAIEEYRKQTSALEAIQKKDSNVTESVISQIVMYYYACAFARDNQPDSAFRYLYENIKYDSSATILSNPDFLSLRKDKRWEEFENKLVSEIITANPTEIKDLSLAKKLWEMGAWDQYYYYEIEIVRKKIGMNSPVEVAIWDSKNKINEKNLFELDSIIAIKGWPKISQVGSVAAGTAFLIVQHSSLEKQEKYLPIIKKLCEQGEAECGNYALMYDRVQVNKNKPQLYGTQLKYNDATKKFELYPIEDEKNVDKRRAEMGMQSLENYVANWGIKYVLPK